MGSYFKDGLSVDETKFSVLMFSYLVTTGFAMYQVVVLGEISENVLMFLGYEIMAITSINVADVFMGKKKSQYNDDSSF